MHLSSLDKMKTFQKQYLNGKENSALKILDLGSMDICGCYRPIFAEEKWEYVGVDLSPGDNVDMVLSDPYRWREIKSNSIDVVISGQSFEHIEFFWLTILEISRILKPGGLCCLIAPSSGPIHRYPVDCWRFYPDGFSALAKFGDLEIVEIYVQTEPTGYPDGSDMWQDLVMVVRKPISPGIRFRIKRWLRHFLLNFML